MPWSAGKYFRDVCGVRDGHVGIVVKQVGRE